MLQIRIYTREANADNFERYIYNLKHGLSVEDCPFKRTSATTWETSWDEWDDTRNEDAFIEALEYAYNTLEDFIALYCSDDEERPYFSVITSNKKERFYVCNV